jgi:hypothetical protein
MQREIIDELDGILDSKGEVFLTIPKIIFLIIVVVSFGLYVGTLLYGKNSLSVLNELKAKEFYLESSIETLKDENAILQKRYFELKGLEPK